MVKKKSPPHKLSLKNEAVIYGLDCQPLANITIRITALIKEMQSKTQ